MADMKSLPKFDMKVVHQYLSPRAMNDFNHFLEKLPQNAGQTILIAGGIAWGFAAALGLFTTIKAQDLNNLRAQLQDAKALKPVVPVMAEVPVEASAIADFVKRLSDIYKGLEIRANGNKIDISAPSTSLFSSFREAVIQVQNGGQNWKIGLENLCVGRECGQKQLSITVKVDTININQPESARIDYQPGTAKERE